MQNAWLDAVEDIRGEREKGMRISSYMNLAPIGGQAASFVSNALIEQ